MREEDLPEYQLMLGYLYAKESKPAQARKHYESALAMGHVNKDMRQFFAKDDKDQNFQWEAQNKLQRYVLRKTARRGGGCRHRWLVRQVARLNRPEASSRSAGAGMKQVRGLGGRQSSETVDEKSGMTEFQRMQEMYEGEEKSE